MDRRVLLAGLFGVAGTAALAVVLPPHAEALAGVPTDDPAPGSNVLPNLEDLEADPDQVEKVAPDEGEQLAWHYGYPHGRRRRRRRRRWRWRRYCRREWWHGYYRRRCRRRPFWVWIWIG
jgi:hypothetical protein